MKRIVLAVLALLLGVASAQDWGSRDLALMMAMQLDAVYGCSIQDSMQADDDADCFTMSMSMSRARSAIDAEMGSYIDIEPATPWVQTESGYYRLYRWTEDGGNDTATLFFGLIAGANGDTIVGVMVMP